MVGEHGSSGVVTGDMSLLRTCGLGNAMWIVVRGRLSALTSFKAQLSVSVGKCDCSGKEIQSNSGEWTTVVPELDNNITSRQYYNKLL